MSTRFSDNLRPQPESPLPRKSAVPEPGFRPHPKHHGGQPGIAGLGPAASNSWEAEHSAGAMSSSTLAVRLSLMGPGSKPESRLMLFSGSCILSAAGQQLRQDWHLHCIAVCWGMLAIYHCRWAESSLGSSTVLMATLHQHTRDAADFGAQSSCPNSQDSHPFI